MKVIYETSTEGTSKEVTIRDWALAEDLFIKWGYDVKQERIAVRNLEDITPELSVWGIPWKWKAE